MADYNVIFDPAAEIDITFQEDDSYSVDFGPGVPISDYDGPYEVTPSSEQQILATKNRTLDENITVGAVAGGSATVSGSATVNPILSVDDEGVITATVNNTLSVTPTVEPGYVSAGTPGSLALSGNTVYQMYKRTSDDLTASNMIVTAPAGYYPEAATKEVPYTWMGKNAEFMSNFYTYSGKLSNTTYSSWTPSTSAGSILATTNCQTFVADMTKYEYIIEWLWCVQMAYPDGQTYKACTDRNFGTMYQAIMRRPYGLDNFASQNWAYNYCTTDYTGSGYCIYWSTGGSKSWTSSQYGVYVSGVTAAGISSTSSNTPTITPKRPVVSAKCNSSYYSTTRAGEVDSANTTIKIVGNLYRVDINTTDMHYQWAKAINMYNNPL